MTRSTKLVVSVLSSILLAGCSTELFDQSYDAYPSEFDPENGVVTIFRESHFVGMGVDAYITVAGRPYGEVVNGSGIQIGLPPGQSVINVHTALASDDLHIPITIEAGGKYYVEPAQQANPMFVAAGAAGYLLNSLKSKVNQYCSPDWCAAIEDETTALPKIEKITLRDRVRKSSF
jgi:hypothetical protein